MTLRVLIAVTHLLGAGHLVRAAAIGRALARAGQDVTLVTGGVPNRLVDTSGMAVVQLPPVRARLGDFGILRDEDDRPVDARHLGDRTERLLACFEEFRPDVVVTELYPFGRRGLAAEYDALLAAAGRARPRPLVLASVRDILVAPDRPEKVHRTTRLIDAHYDAVLVHGDESLVPLEASWPVDDRLRGRLRYTGYVGEANAPAHPPARPDDRVVLVSGGSSAASLPLYRAALAAARHDGRHWHVLVGHGVGPDDFAALERDAGSRTRVERARADFRDLLAKSAVFVGQAGYNTVMDIVATQARSVLVPFEGGRETEQRLRAEFLARAGLAELLPEDALTPERLRDAVRLAAGRPAPDFSSIRLDGAERSAALVAALAAERSAVR